MKKVLLLLMITMVGIVHGFAQYQLSNGGFENWSGSATSVPSGWHTFSDAQCELWMGCSMAKGNHHERAAGHEGGNSCCIYSKEVGLLGINHLANGNFTTGQIYIGSSTASDQTQNYNRSVSGYREPFTGYPDSLRFWASFYATGANEKARLSAIIHNSEEMRDPVPSSFQNRVVATMEKAFTRTTSTSSSAGTSWQQPVPRRRWRSVHRRCWPSACVR